MCKLTRASVAGLVILTTCVSIAVYSQDEPPLDLSVEDAVSLALISNVQLTNSRLRRSVDTYALKLAESEFWPQVVTTAYTDRDDFATSKETSAIDSSIRLRVRTGGEFSLGSRVLQTADGFEDATSHAGVTELTFRQPLLRGAGLKMGSASLRQARIAEETSILVLKSSVINLITDVIRTYRSHVQAHRQSDIAARSLQRAQDLREINQLLVQTGRMAEQDVVQAEADIARRELDLVASQGIVDSTRLALLDILDMKTETEFGELSTLVASEISSPSIAIDEGLTIALENRPDFLTAELAATNAEIQSEVATNSRLWDLSLNLGWTFSGNNEDFSRVFDEQEKTGQRVSLDLEIPLGRAAAGQAELAHRRAKANLQIAQNNVADLRQKIEIDVSNAIRNVDIAARRVEIAERARQLAEEKAEIEREKLSLGVTTNFQLVVFENDLVIAETNGLRATVDYLNAVTALDRALGTTLERWQVDIERLEPLSESEEPMGAGAVR